MEQYVLADLPVEWNGNGVSLYPGLYLPRFSGEAQGEGIRLTGVFEDLAPYVGSPLIRREGFHELHMYQGEPVLIYSWAALRYAYAVFPHRIGAEREIVCLFDPALKNHPPIPADWFIGVSGLHRALLHRDRPVLHGSYIDHRGKAILFCAPSQTGKSTQAALWQQHAGARIVNGDRVLLGKRADRWYAHGYPCCGSSDICVNRSLPLEAIVFLEQGSENRVEQVPLARKIRGLAAGMAIYSWDSWEVDRAFELAGQICQAVPVVQLVCRPDAGAVSVLREFLEV